MLEPEAVADAVVAGIDAESFLILPHPEVLEYFRRKASDYERWLNGMRRLQARFGGAGEVPDMTDPLVLADDPRPHVRRITLNRPEKRNAMSNLLRAELFDELRRGDQDNDVSVMVVRGAGVCFSAGLRPQPRPEPAAAAPDRDT